MYQQRSLIQSKNLIIRQSFYWLLLRNIKKFKTEFLNQGLIRSLPSKLDPLPPRAILQTSVKTSFIVTVSIPAWWHTNFLLGYFMDKALWRLQNWASNSEGTYDPDLFTHLVTASQLQKITKDFRLGLEGFYCDSNFLFLILEITNIPPTQDTHGFPEKPSSILLSLFYSIQMR